MDQGKGQTEPEGSKDHVFYVDRGFMQPLPPCVAGRLSAGSRDEFTNGIQTSNSLTGSSELP